MAMLHLSQQLLHGVAWKTAQMKTNMRALQNCEGEGNKMHLTPAYDIFLFYSDTTRTWMCLRRREDYSDVILSQRPSSMIAALHCAC